MVEDMRRRGFIIGSHTRNHVSLPVESTDRVAEEVEQSKADLERRLGEQIDHFANPGAISIHAVVDEVARAGYRFAYTACRHEDPRHPLLTIERLLLWEGFLGERRRRVHAGDSSVARRTTCGRRHVDASGCTS
jgi:peptidoglycan/xylan/chitin deacetylase (PgdA/CDA1 family)